MSRVLRVERAEPNPQAIILTSTGWQFPDGTFKPHYTAKRVTVVQRKGFFARWITPLGKEVRNHIKKANAG